MFTQFKVKQDKMVHDKKFYFYPFAFFLSNSQHPLSPSHR